MPANNTEKPMNKDLCRVLWTKHPDWEECIDAEMTGLVDGNSQLQIDILVRHPNGLPVVIETEFGTSLRLLEEARARLRKKLSHDCGAHSGKRIEQVIALSMPENLKGRGNIDRKLENAQYEFCVLSICDDEKDGERRWPSNGWIEGGIDDLAAAIEHTALSEDRIEKGMTIFDSGALGTAEVMHAKCENSSPDTLKSIAKTLCQKEGIQTTRMAMSILVNALSFHTAIAGSQGIMAVDGLAKGEFPTKRELMAEWTKILKINYVPIFAVALDILKSIPGKIACDVLRSLVEVVDKLELLGATSQHDFNGRLFQKLISDRKFLATFYTLPTSATLLAELVMARQGTDWSSEEEITNLRIADFACGTGALLSAAYNSVRSRHRRKGGNDSEIHSRMLERVLVGSDVMPIATHLTASVLSSAHPKKTFRETQIITMRYGRGVDRSGNERVFIGSLDLFNDEYDMLPIIRSDHDHHSGTDGTVERDVEIPHESFDAVIMNPPFTRFTASVEKYGNVPIPSFGGMETSHEEQQNMTEQLDLIRPNNKRGNKKAGNKNAGLATIFMDLAHLKLKEGGGSRFDHSLDLCIRENLE